MSEFVENISKNFVFANDLRNFIVLISIPLPKIRLENVFLENRVKFLNETLVRVNFWANGNMKEEIFYKRGKKEGRYRTFYQTGRQKTESTYINDKMEGIYREWYPNGRPRDEMSYKNGIANGPYITWFDNGNIQTTGNLKNGENDGIWYYWNREFNRKETEIQYRNGRIIL